MPIDEIRVRKELFAGPTVGLLLDKIMEAIAASETDREVVLTLDQAIAVAQVAATVRVANAITNSTARILDQ